MRLMPRKPVSGLDFATLGSVSIVGTDADVVASVAGALHAYAASRSV